MTEVAGFPISTVPRTTPEQVRLVAVPTAVVRRAALTMDGLRGFFDAGFAALAAAVTPAGPAFAIYRGDPATVFDAEIGFPITTPLAASVPGDVIVDPSSFPPGPALALSHVGGYDTLSQSWQALVTAVGATGAIPTSTFIEVYLTEPRPDSDPATMRTELFAPLPG